MEEPTLNSKLFLAIANGKIRQIDKLLGQLDDFDVRDTDDRTPLMYAVCCENEEVRTHVVRMLLRHDANVNAQDFSGYTALMLACMECERVDIVRLISRNKKCNFNIQDREGYTAVMHAINSSNIYALKLLVELSSKQEVDLKLRNHNSLNALELAVKLQLSEFCKCLIYDGNVKETCVRDQKGLRMLLERDTKPEMSLNLGKLTPDISTLNFARPATPMTNWVRRETTFDRDYNRLLEDVDSGRISKSMHYKEPLTPTSARSSVDWMESPRRQRRALKPIMSKDQQISHTNYIPSLHSQSPVFGHRMRLPSIPSGKRLCLVSTPNGSYENAQEIL